MKNSGNNYEKIILGLINFALLFLYCSFIFWLSDQSKLHAPSVFNHQDKMLHVGAYFVMGVLAWRSFNSFTSDPTILAIVTLAFCSLYGWSDEWHQSFVPGRNADTMDWLADTVGATISVGMMFTLVSRKQNLPVPDSR